MRLHSSLHLLLKLSVLLLSWLYNPFWLGLFSKKNPKLSNRRYCLLVRWCLLTLIIFMYQNLHSALSSFQVSLWFNLIHLWLKNQWLSFQLKLLLAQRKFLNSLHLNPWVCNKISCSKYFMHFRSLVLLNLWRSCLP